MSDRYLAVWKDGRSGLAITETQDRVGLTLAFESQALQVFVEAPAAVIPMLDGSGVIVGRLFSSRDSSRISVLDQVACDRIRRSEGGTLIDDYWGRYVAFLTDANGSSIALRDPSAALPCYFVKARDCTFFASDAETLDEAGAPIGEIDWIYMGQHLRTPGYWWDRTCLSGVRELPRGTRIRSADPTRQDILWNPWQYADDPREYSEKEAAANLAKVVLTTVQAWAVEFDQTLLSLSGGLDSSILAAGLGRRPHKTTAITMVTDDQYGDERTFARLAAEETGIDLREVRYQHDHIDIRKSISSTTPRPTGRAIGQSFLQSVRTMAKDTNAAALIMGGGGDSVFCHTQSAGPIVDRLLAEGLGRGVWTTLNDVCALANCSYLEALKAAVRRVKALRRGFEWKVEDSLLDANYVKSLPALVHPWMEAASSRPPGKVGHVAAIAIAHNFGDGEPPGSDLTILSPLLSQPILEAVLRVPSWMWYSGGRDRAVARLAFEDLLPERIIARRSKGSPRVFNDEVYQRHLTDIREILLDGLLAQNGLVDRSAIERFLRGTVSQDRGSIMGLMGLVDAEAWVQHWTRRVAARSVPLPVA